MTWKCPVCNSNNVRFRSWTRDYKCMICGHIMDNAPVAKPTRYSTNGRPPKFIARV